MIAAGPPGGRRRLVVLDATELTRDWQLRGNAHRLLHYLDWQVVVPAVVLDEARSNFAREAAELRRGVQRLSEAARRMGIRMDGARIPDGAEDDYAAHLQDVLALLEAEIAPYPDAQHAAVARRAMNRRAPFDDNGGGYRDTLVWLSLLGHAREGDEVVLASRDKGFASRDGRLAASLAQEAADAGLSALLARDLAAWAKGQLPWVRAASARDALDEAREDRLFEYLSSWDFQDVWVSAGGLGLPSYEDDVLLEIVDSYGFVRGNISSEPDGAVLVAYHASMRAQIDFTTDEATAAANGWDYGREPGRFGVTAQVELPVRAEMDVLFDEHMGELGPFDVVRLDFLPTRPGDWHAPQTEVAGQLVLDDGA